MSRLSGVKTSSEASWLFFCSGPSLLSSVTEGVRVGVSGSWEGLGLESLLVSLVFCGSVQCPTPLCILPWMHFHLICTFLLVMLIFLNTKLKCQV